MECGSDGGRGAAVGGEWRPDCGVSRPKVGEKERR